MTHTAEGLVVLAGDAVVYECESKQEAIRLARAANEFYQTNGYDHSQWEELEPF